MLIQQGSRVRLATPGNPRLDGAYGVVKTLTRYGAIVECKLAGSGEFRALFEEMVADTARTDRSLTLAVGSVTGNSCSECGSLNMLRTGRGCETCQDCGSNTGCS